MGKKGRKEMGREEKGMARRKQKEKYFLFEKKNFASTPTIHKWQSLILLRVVDFHYYRV